MQRRSIIVSCLLACALAGGCAGSDSGAIGPVGDVLVPVPAETPAPDPAPAVTIAPPITDAPAADTPTIVVPAAEAPPAPAPPATDAPRPVVATTPVPAPILPVAAARGGCDPSYPGVCIPLGPPDLDCADIPHRHFTVLAPDPHRFDGNGDGAGCEMP
ncbi:MAG TPA: hypothetical protein VM942_09210 [Acidimicrobiales bacterium]|nr:hypothetical protein [Acidimicrobiales bacterium]